MLKSITYSLKVVPCFKISKGIGRYNTTSLLVLSKASTNASKCLEITF
jgi:hypothetical protein